MAGKIGELANVFLLVVIGLGLTPSVAQYATDAKANTSGLADVLLDLVAPFWVMMLIGVLIAYVNQWLKSG